MLFSIPVVAGAFRNLAAAFALTFSGAAIAVANTHFNIHEKFAHTKGTEEHNEKAQA